MKILNKHIESSAALSEPDFDSSNTVLDKEGGVIAFPIPFLNWAGKNHLDKIREDLLEFAKYYPDNMENAPSWVTEIYQDKTLWTNGFPVVYREPYVDFERIYMDTFQSEVNNLIAVTSEPNYAWAQKSLFRVYECLQKETYGKSGILTRKILGYRVPGSVNFICTIDSQLMENQVGIPASHAFNSGIEDGDFVIIIRNPVLHHLSVLVMRAVVCDQYHGALPLHAFHGLNADCDGDMISVTRIPDEFTDSPENVKLLNSIASSNFKESKLHGSLQFAAAGIKDPYQQHITLLNVGGMTFGPSDVIDLDNSPFVKQLKETKAKKLKPNVQETFFGDVNLEDSSMAIVKEQAAIKLKLGMAGWVGTCALIVAGIRPSKEMVRAGYYLKESLSQKVLDCKHGEDLSELEMVISALTKSGDFKKASVDECLSALAGAGMDVEVIAPMLDFCHPYSITSSATYNSPMFVASTSWRRTDAMEILFNSTKQAPGVSQYTVDYLKGLHAHVYRTLDVLESAIGSGIEQPVQ